MLETFYVHLVFQNRVGSWSVNLPFLCDMCGVCCSLEDFLTAGKIHGSSDVDCDVYAKFDALKEELGVLFERGEEEYERYVAGVKCPFQRGNVCSIYSIRPDGCRQFPNTPFGMLSEDCAALDRFKKQRLALKRGFVVKETGHFTVDSLLSVKFSDVQYTRCVEKLCKVGVTEQELRLFNMLNKL
ncbi:YkgJ family cysteine cluster protein [Candidatus Bathycorpusculum sp.]|uniref:YkgJ family cysteine cluster protein n=2 Tax=Candidatus Bathycorpusculum sp. TaxID=2994959 RepID=UPI0031CCC104